MNRKYIYLLFCESVFDILEMRLKVVHLDLKSTIGGGAVIRPDTSMCVNLILVL